MRLPLSTHGYGDHHTVLPPQDPTSNDGAPVDTDVRWEEVGHMIAVSTITLDRRQWEIGGGAPAIANAAIDHDIQLSVSLDARRKQAAVATR